MQKTERIGKLRHRVTIQQYTTAQDTFGQEEVTFSTLATVWAAYEYKASGSDERQIADRKTAVSTVMWTLRHRSDVEPKMRIIDEAGNVYDILSVMYDHYKEYMIAECQNVGLGGVIVGPPVPGVTDPSVTMYRQTFTGITDDTVTVTEANLPDNADNIQVFVNGQYLTEWTHTGNVIAFTFTIDPTDFVTVQWWP